VLFQGKSPSVFASKCLQPRSGGLRTAEAHGKPMSGGICKLQLLAFQALTFAIFALFGYYVDE
jgi:hypothetical protein